ncbi:MAG: hypothetical protein A4E65_02870 [Syntrophorhabdus sp. PtaU1.Bin153]|nr:MAG: hypothetical protein A4E65_02870 [Syntrophorhabdus sp. PtaU1.Bin153]
MKQRAHGVRMSSIILAVLVVFAMFTDLVEAKTANEINVSVNEAINRFYKQVDGAREFMGQARAVLVMPNVTKAGFVVGGQYGEGALRVGGETRGYYNLIAGSYGFTFGAQQMDIIIAFMTDGALKSFHEVEGWEVGVDGNVALIDVGAGTRLDTTTLRDPIVGFVFDAKGLMLDISLKGAKFTEIKR